ncbi:DUF6476 family protein [Pontivivens insulae]|nr:DUF6476 family protein [Pontivivens insulae]RED14257.1 hypothetical protein DFR53_1613 [Pontivivens insulae]
MEPSPPQDLPEPPKLAFLRRLVTTLTIVMILAVITVVGLLVIRLSATAPARPTLPDEIEVPAGEVISAVTFGQGWYAVVTMLEDGDQVLRLHRADGTTFDEVLIPAD